MIKGKVNDVMVFSLAEAIDLIMRDEIDRSPKRIMMDLNRHNIYPSRQALHKVIRKMVKENILRRGKYGNYEYIPLPLLPDIVQQKKIQSAIELQLLHEEQKTEESKMVDSQNKEYLDQLFAEGKMFVTGKGEPIKPDETKPQK